MNTGKKIYNNEEHIRQEFALESVTQVGLKIIGKVYLHSNATGLNFMCAFVFNRTF